MTYLMSHVTFLNNTCGWSYMLYICYTYSDIEVGLCLKALVIYLTLGHVARARVILMQKITN